LFKGNKSKKLAFFAAMTLVGGAFAPYTYAADVTIDPAHPPVKNVPRPLTTGAAGGVGADGADASENTLTIQDYDYENNAVYGGAALGTGNAERNTLTIMNSKVLVGYGGAAQNGGNTNHNKLVFRSGEGGATMAGGACRRLHAAGGRDRRAPRSAAEGVTGGHRGAWGLPPRGSKPQALGVVCQVEKRS